jgi:hypothetical protein
MKGGDLVAVLDGMGAFFDASGTDTEQPVWAVGGWLGTADDWELLDSQWQKMIDGAPWRESVPHDKRIYHATDLESCVGIYEGWTKDEKQRFQGEAYGIIERLPSLVPVSSSLIKKDWNAAGVKLERTHDALHPGNYFITTVFDVLRAIRTWADEHNYDGPIHYFFEAGDIGQGNVDGALRTIYNTPKRRARCRMASYTFAHKNMRPLQSADLWAYEAYKEMVNRNLGALLKDRRYPMSRLWNKRFERYNTYFDRERLDDIVEKGRKMVEGKDY